MRGRPGPASAAQRTNRVLVGVVLAVALVAASAVVVDANRAPEDMSHRLDGCQPAVPTDVSTARIWNEALLDGIRLDFPAPTVHARNLFHTSVAMWDIWAAYDPVARGVMVDEEQETTDVAAAREEAMSFAVYRILVDRYLDSPGAEASITGFDRLMEDLCLDRTFVGTVGDSPAAFGNRVAATILGSTVEDGSNEEDGYVDPDYEPVNPNLVVADPGTTLVDPNRWQPLELEVMVSQTGIPLTDTVQTFVGSQWGAVTPFALGPTDEQGLRIDPGPPPMLGDPETDADFKDAAVEVIAHSATLDPASGVAVDIGPASRGNAVSGTYEERGRPVNPVTGAAYEPVTVDLGDYGRAVAEFWADGPSSETPPGHWNTLANAVTDALGPDRRIGGQGDMVDPLEWDVKLYLALNGSMHDAAVAGWGLKSHYDYVRPISMIRWMGGLGQSSDPDGPSFHPDGLPLVPGLVEVVTPGSTAAGERHAHLGDHVGELAVLAWRGTPDDPEHEVGGVGWIRAVEWVPYQLSTFVTPAFAGYVSGHSTFSRAGAEVLAAITGSELFPGGYGEWVVPAGSLEFEAGPSTDVALRWATYVDAAEEAGRSRLYGGIHVRADDLAGRAVGEQVGQRAWEFAVAHFDGTVAGSAQN